jgi:arylsulfatase A-like enzyme
MSARNVLFIMCDQLRRDHLGCYGHPTLRTRNIDALAARGVRFDNAFVTSGVCGPSRMSFYTGRYVSSHGATWNRVPLSVGEITLGEYLKDSGRALALAARPTSCQTTPT